MALSESDLILKHSSIRYQALVHLIKVFSLGDRQTEAPLSESQLVLDFTLERCSKFTGFLQVLQQSPLSRKS